MIGIEKMPASSGSKDASPEARAADEIANNGARRRRQKKRHDELGRGNAQIGQIVAGAQHIDELFPDVDRIRQQQAVDAPESGGEIPEQQNGEQKADLNGPAGELPRSAAASRHYAVPPAPLRAGDDSVTALRISSCNSA